MLTIEDAIKNLNRLDFLEEKKPEGFYCSRFSQEGIIIITNYRISFFFLGDDNEFQFEHIIYNLISKANLNINNDTSWLDISYAYDKQRFNFLYKQDILAVKRLLELYIPSKVQVDFLEQGEQISDKPDVIDCKNKGTQNIKVKETRPLIYIDKFTFKRPFKEYLKKAISLIISLILIYSAYSYIYRIKDKVLPVVTYGMNFIEFQRCESEMFLIGQALNEQYKHTKSLPKDLPEFIRMSFKTRFSKDSARDIWGNLYRLQEEKNVFKIISDGPDKEKNTYDDFVKEFTKLDTPIQ